MNGCYIVEKGKVSKVAPLCVLDTSKPGAWSARALVEIPREQELTVSYGDDTKRMMFGLPLPSNKRMRTSSQQKPKKRQQRNRKEEKLSAVRNELQSLKQEHNRKVKIRRAVRKERLSLTASFSIPKCRQGLRSSSSAQALKRKRT